MSDTIVIYGNDAEDSLVPLVPCIDNAQYVIRMLCEFDAVYPRHIPNVSRSFIIGGKFMGVWSGAVPAAGLPRSHFALCVKFASSLGLKIIRHPGASIDILASPDWADLIAENCAMFAPTDKTAAQKWTLWALDAVTSYTEDKSRLTWCVMVCGVSEKLVFRCIDEVIDPCDRDIATMRANAARKRLSSIGIRAYAYIGPSETRPTSSKIYNSASLSTAVRTGSSKKIRRYMKNSLKSL